MGEVGRQRTCAEAGRYRQLFLVDDDGEIVHRDIPRILSLLKCAPDTPAEPLPEGYNEMIMGIKKQFDREVEARRAERRHTLSLIHAQRYVLRELRILYDDAEDKDLRAQIAKLEAAFRRPNPRPAVRSELNRLRRESVHGMALLHALTQVYHVYGLDRTQSKERTLQVPDDDPPRIVCSEALLG